MSKGKKTLFDVKDVNINLRATILEHALHLEFHSKEIIYCILRTLKDETKTLGNQGSSLSYKTKIDILYDLEELKADEYAALVKQMEIRNQFIHNYEVNTFQDLIDLKPEFKKYLDKNYPKENENTELKYFSSYLELYNHCSAWLIMIKQQFRAGISKAFGKYIDHMIIKNIDEVLLLSDQKFLGMRRAVIEALGSNENTEELPPQIEDYKKALKFAIAEKSLEISKTITDTEVLKKIMSHKHSTQDQINELYKK